jgi:molecular chaperone GrpE (heat shock protein)
MERMQNEEGNLKQELIRFMSSIKKDRSKMQVGIDSLLEVIDKHFAAVQQVRKADDIPQTVEMADSICDVILRIISLYSVVIQRHSGEK